MDCLFLIYNKKERCKISCGCRKSKDNKRAKLKNTNIKLSVNNKNRKEKIIRRDLVAKKLKFCRTCPHSRQTREERRNKTKICHKNDISIQSILNNKKSKCPINNF